MKLKSLLLPITLMVDPLKMLSSALQAGPNLLRSVLIFKSKLHPSVYKREDVINFLCQTNYKVRWDR